jgi:hypothetical protein
MKAREILLLENQTKGARNVLNDKRLVAGIAAAIRDDHTAPREIRKDRTKSDLDLATWFVDQLDSLDSRGLGGVVSVRDGKNHMWIAKGYAAGNDIWEDIAGEYPEAIRDFMILKNRNMLDERHSDLMKFRGVKDLHRYMVVHYEKLLGDLRKDAELSSIIKNKRAVLVVDQPEYKIWLLQNRGAACAFGKGATYCTANSRDSTMWNSYSSKSAIFGMVPTEKKTYSGSALPGGKYQDLPEKFQFDAGSHSFRNPLDHQMNSEEIKERFPYLLSDLIKGLNDNREDIEDPKAQEGVETKVYNVADEIRKLKTGLATFWTNEQRPKAKEPTSEPTEEPKTTPTT